MKILHQKSNILHQFSIRRHVDSRSSFSLAEEMIVEMNVEQKENLPFPAASACASTSLRSHFCIRALPDNQLHQV